jgi:outer membrane protein assembly factor BamB
VRDGRVFLGDLAGVFHAVSAADGKKDLDGRHRQQHHASANDDGERVVFGNDGAEVYCLNAADGKEVWKISTGDRVNSAPGRHQRRGAGFGVRRAVAWALRWRTGQGEVRHRPRCALAGFPAVAAEAILIAPTRAGS